MLQYVDSNSFRFTFHEKKWKNNQDKVNRHHHFLNSAEKYWMVRHKINDSSESEQCS